MSNSTQVSVLFLASSPADQPGLALTREFEDIRDELRIRCPRRFTVESRWHTKATDLPRLVMGYRPHVLHFSGHGQGTGELMFESEDGRARSTDPRAVARVFELLGDTVRCVLLNACYSEEQARLIAAHVDVVIGMSDRIRNSDAGYFAKGFYEGLSFGKSVEEAFELAKLAVWLGGSDGQEIPRLHVRPGVDPRQVFVGTSADVAESRRPPEYVFVAHARADKLRVVKLCRDLLDRGVRPWLDMWDLLPGSDWQVRMQEALLRAPAVLIVDGPSGSGVDNPEYGAALRERLERDRDTVYRVELSGTLAVEGLDMLADRIGIDQDRRTWLELESRASDGDPTPYRGLRAFGERDARWMFGRDEEIAELLTRVQAGAAEKSRFLTVIGASGSGKSSLVMGGLCPALRHGVLEDGRVWKLTTLRPGDQPCEALAEAVVNLQIEFGEKADSVIDGGKVATLSKQMLESHDAMRLVMRRLVSANRESKILLVIDQLEELFTEGRLGQTGESPGAMAFVRNLVAAAADGDVPLWVVSTLRADFLQSCLAIPDLARTLKLGIYPALPPMRRVQILEAVTLPARRVGFEVEPSLVETLVVAAAEQAGRLPLLEHVLQVLWRERDKRARVLRFAAYENAGGLEGAIAAEAERALAGLRERLGERADAVTRRVMSRLVRIGEGTEGDTRRRAMLAQLGTDDETQLVLDAFVRDARVLVGNEVDAVQVIEIAHEALLREWTTLVGWLNADREALRWREEIGRDAAKFAGKRDPEYLWGKGRLEVAKRILEASSVELDGSEREFIETCERAVQEKLHTEHLRHGRVRASVVLAFIILLGVLTSIAQLNAKNAKLAENERVAREASDAAAATADAAAAAAKEAQQSAQTGEALQKCLRASMVVANGGSFVEGAVLAIDAIQTLGPNWIRIPTAYQGFMGVVGAQAVVELATLEGHTGVLRDVAFSPDGSRIATASDDKTARLWDAASGNFIRSFEGHSDRVNAVAFSPDGSSVATASADKTARLWDVVSGDFIPFEGHSSEVDAVAFSRDGSRLATASGDTTRLWDTASGNLAGSLQGSNGMTFSPDGSRIATASDKITHIWDVASGKSILTLRGHSDEVLTVAFSPDGSRVATAGRDKAVCVWDAVSGKRVATLRGHSDLVDDVAFSPDGSRIATASYDKTARIWHAESGDPISILQTHSEWVETVAFSPDGSRIATAGIEDIARIWDAASGNLICSLRGHSSAAVDVAFSPDGLRVVTASWDNTARIWDAASGDLIPALQGHSGVSVEAVAFSPDGSRIATASSDHTTLLWNATSGNRISLLNHSAFVSAMAFSPDSSILATASDDAVRLWDAISGDWMITLEGHSDDVNDVAFSSDSSRIATASRDKTAGLWNAKSGGFIVALEGHSGSVSDLAFSRDGSRIATTDGRNVRLWDASGKLIISRQDDVNWAWTEVAFSIDGSILAVFGEETVALWDTHTDNLIYLKGHSGWVTEVAFSPGGSILATAGWDHAPRLWDVASGNHIVTLRGHSGPVQAVAFSPDGTLLASVSSDKTIRLWDVASRTQLATLQGYSASVDTLAFSPDGSRLITPGDGNTVRIWPVSTQLALQLVCRRIRHAVSYREVAATCDPLLKAAQ